MTRNGTRLPQRKRLRRPPAPVRAGRRRSTATGSSRSAARATSPATSTRGTEVVDLAGGMLLPGFVDAHVHPVQGGLERVRCDLSEARRPARTTSRTVRGVRRRAPRAAVDPRRRLGDVRVPRRHADRGRPRHRGPGPAGVPAQPRPPRRLGEQPARCELAGIDRRQPGPRATAASSATPTGARPAPCTRARWRLVLAALPAHHRRRELRRALLEGQRYLHSLGVTAWQDAILGAYAGMDDAAPTYLRAATQR